MAQIGGGYHEVVSCEVDCASYCYGGTGRGVEHLPDARHIATFDPPTVLDLIALVREEQQKRAEAEAVIDIAILLRDVE